MKFYSDVLDELFDTQAELEAAEARVVTDEEKQALVAEINALTEEVKGILEEEKELQKRFYAAENKRVAAKIKFLDEYGPEEFQKTFLPEIGKIAAAIKDAVDEAKANPKAKVITIKDGKRKELKGKEMKDVIDAFLRTIERED